VYLLPGGPVDVSGFPDLSRIPASSVGPTVQIDTILATDGSVRAYRIVSGASVLADTIGSSQPGAGEHASSLFLDRALSRATQTLDGQVRWSGSVTATGSAWYQVDAS
jgi:hypothetical protein